MSSPVPFSQDFAIFLVNYLHFTFLIWIPCKLLFFLKLTAIARPVRSSISLVSTANGIAQPLPAELGPLPLYLDGDGFCSVLGPPLGHPMQGDHTDGSNNHTLASSHFNIPAILTAATNKVFCRSSKCSGNRFATPFGILKYIFLANTLTQRSGPHTCPRRSHTCNVPGCTVPGQPHSEQNRHSIDTMR